MHCIVCVCIVSDLDPANKAEYLFLMQVQYILCKQYKKVFTNIQFDVTVSPHAHYSLCI